MNDLMTKSFFSYVELKKQGLKDQEFEHNLETGHQIDSTDEQNLLTFFEEVAAIKNDMEEITDLLFDLQDLNQETKSIHGTKILRGVRDRIKSNMVIILRKARNMKSRLESLDKSNVEKRKVPMVYKAGSHIDRTRISVANGLCIKLREMMHDFRSLREKIVRDHKEGLKRQYYNVTREQTTEEVIEKMILGSEQETVFKGKEELVMETREMQEALKEIQRSLTELHQAFLDMAVLVETQGEQINDIQENVTKAGVYINGGTNGLFYAKQMKKKRRNWASAFCVPYFYISFLE